MTTFPDLSTLSTTAKLDLIDQIWDSIGTPPGPHEISDAMKRELDKRHEEFLRDPSQAVDWKEAKAKILSDYAKRQNTPPRPS